MASQDNDSVINFGKLTADVNRPAKIGLRSASSGGTLWLRRDITTIVDRSGDEITDAQIDNETNVLIPASSLRINLTGGGFEEVGRAEMLERILAGGDLYWFLTDTNNVELTGSNGLTRQLATSSHFSPVT